MSVCQVKSVLYVVATPIGNLDDMAPRAVKVLSQVDIIAAEDTRHSLRLLNRFGITTRMLALHEHNERTQTQHLLSLLRAGKSIALVSDAGTPLLSDPGYHLVRSARAAGMVVTPIPGPCAAIAALCVAGLPTDRFVFEGFPPAKASARRAHFHALVGEPRTLVFYESPHRIAACLSDMRSEFGDAREAVIARELTKKFETIRAGTLQELCDTLVPPGGEVQGEFVVLVHGASNALANTIEGEAERVLAVLLRELPLKQASALAATITGLSKNRLYERALDLQRGSKELKASDESPPE